MKKILIIFLGLIFLPVTSFGQLGASSLSSELGVEIVPTYPKANQTVSINLTLYTGDLNSADITWYQNGKNVLSGRGETRHSFKMGPVGEETKIEIQIKLLNGTSFSKTFTLNSVGVDLVWEANSYVPPFYKGKALHSLQGSLKVVAMPDFVKDGRRITPQNLIYEWSNGTSVYENQSGYGKNTLVLNGSLLGRAEQIDVLVRDPVNNLVATGFITITPLEPNIVFYENNAYYGHLFESAISGIFDLKTEEVQVLAAPYYFSKEVGSKIKYDWRLNGTSVPELSNSRTAIFKRPEGEGGRSNITLNIENLNRVLQQASSNLIMNFENQDE